MGSDLQNGVSRSNGRRSCKTFDWRIHAPKCREYLNLSTPRAPTKTTAEHFGFHPERASRATKPLPREGLGWGQICKTAQAVATTGGLAKHTGNAYTHLSTASTSTYPRPRAQPKLPQNISGSTRSALRARQKPSEGGFGVGSDLQNGVSRSNDRRSCKEFGWSIHTAKYYKALSYNGASRSNGRQTCKTFDWRIHAPKCREYLNLSTPRAPTKTTAEHFGFHPERASRATKAPPEGGVWGGVRSAKRRKP